MSFGQDYDSHQAPDAFASESRHKDMQRLTIDPEICL